MGRHKLKEQKLVPQATAQAIQLSLPSQAPLERLARSLDEFGSNVAGIAVRKQNEAAQEERERGAVAGALAIAEGRATEDELEADGIITKGEGSFFRDGVLEMAGNAEADAFSNAVLIAAGEENLHESENPKAMDELIERISQEFGGDDRGEAFAAGFAGRAATLMSQHLSRHAMTVAGNLEKLNNDQLTDLMRGGILEAIEGTDPNFIVENATDILIATGLKWSENNTNWKPRDKRLLNKATTAAIAGAVREGLLTGDQAERIMKNIPTGKGSFLWSIQNHADVIEDAINKFVSTESARNKFAQDIVLDEQKTAGVDAIARMFARQLEDGGKLDITEIMVLRSLNQDLFLDRFIEDTERMILVDEKARQQKWVGNAAMFDGLLGRILSGETLNIQGLVNFSVEDGKLNMSQVAILAQSQASHQNMLNNNPEKSARFRRTDNIVQVGMKSWAGAQDSTAQYLAALPAMAAELQKWEDNPANAGFGSTSPEFLKFATKLVLDLQTQFMSQDQWRTMQERQLDLERDNRVAPYTVTSYEADPDVLLPWYAEALMIREGRNPSSSFSAFVGKSGREIPADAPVGDYAAAISGQLALVGVDVTDKKITAKVDALLEQFKPLADEDEAEAVSEPALKEETPEEELEPAVRGTLRFQQEQKEKEFTAVGVFLGKVLGLGITIDPIITVQPDSIFILDFLGKGRKVSLDDLRKENPGVIEVIEASVNEE